MSGTANFLDHDTYIPHDMDGWMDLPIVEGQESIQIGHEHFMRIPEVIVLKNYERFPEREVKLSRRNLLIRDSFTCQYSGKKVSASEATIDHVFPQSRGGKTVWENVVIATVDANRKKADRTPSEAGMSLLKVPRRPEWSPLYSRFSKITSYMKIPDSWQKFIPEKWDVASYWDVELEK
jgi:5-methylcytosine-specific restriction endonuclease McrA